MFPGKHLTDADGSNFSSLSESSVRDRFKLLSQYLRKHRRSLALGIGSMVARDSISFSVPLLIRSGVNALTQSHPQMSITTVGLLMMAVAVPRSFFQTMARLFLMSSSREVEYEIRRDFLTHLFRLDSKFWGHTRIGDVMACATNDLNAVRMMLGPGIASLFESLVSLPVAFIVMAAIDWKLTVLAFAPAPLTVWLMVRFGHIIRVRFDRIQEMFSSMSASVQQTIAGVRLVRAFVREDVELRRFEKINQEYVRANSVLALYSSALDPLLAFVTGVAVLIVLFYGGHQVITSKLAVGSFVMFTTYVAALIRPISSLGRVVNLVQRGSASVGRLQALFRERPEIVSVSHGIPAPRATNPRGEVFFDQVSVYYGTVAALTSFEVSVPSGSTVALLGRTGSGKSTAVRLLPRLIDPTKGRLMIDGIDSRDLPLTTLRSMIGLVPQETFLFSATLSENIAFGVPQAEESDIRRVAEIAGLSNDIESFPAGFETLVGERGIMLSGGQKQRIAIARAILRNPRILVLDDALSSVDSVTEGRILQELRSIMDERTTFLITHRVSTAQRADQIIVLDGGRIIEQGSHNELIALGGHYSRMRDLQVLEEELEVM